MQHWLQPKLMFQYNKQCISTPIDVLASPISLSMAKLWNCIKKSFKRINSWKTTTTTTQKSLNSIKNEVTIPVPTAITNYHTKQPDNTISSFRQIDDKHHFKSLPYCSNNSKSTSSQISWKRCLSLIISCHDWLWYQKKMRGCQRLRVRPHWRHSKIKSKKILKKQKKIEHASPSPSASPLYCWHVNAI